MAKFGTFKFGTGVKFGDYVSPYAAETASSFTYFEEGAFGAGYFGADWFGLGEGGVFAPTYTTESATPATYTAG